MAQFKPSGLVITVVHIMTSKVIGLRRGRKMVAGSTREVWARRLALQITTQLPESEEEAIEVLKYARDLLGFVSRGRFHQASISMVVAANKLEQKT